MRVLEGADSRGRGGREGSSDGGGLDGVQGDGVAKLVDIDSDGSVDSDGGQVCRGGGSGGGIITARSDGNVDIVSNENSVGGVVNSLVLLGGGEGGDQGGHEGRGGERGKEHF